MWSGAITPLSVEALTGWILKFENWSVIFMPVALVLALIFIPWILGKVLQLFGDVHAKITGGGVIVGDYFHRMSREEAEAGLTASGAQRLGGPGLRERSQEWAYTDESGKIVTTFDETWWEEVQRQRG